MLSHKLKNCPLGKDDIRQFLIHMAADGHIDDQGSLVLTFNNGLPEHKATEHFSLLREYFRSLRQKDPLYEAIDTEEIDPDRHIHTVASSIDFKIETFGAFGSGIHETTAGCMELIAQYCESRTEKLDSIRALDIGTGTGILSVFSYYQGIRDITAVDISLRAVISALHNFILNDMADHVRLKQGSLAAADGEFDIIIANIFLSAITDLFDDIYAKTVAGGTIILSGIKKTGEDEVLMHIRKYPSLRIKKKLVRDEWLCLSLDKDH